MEKLRSSQPERQTRIDGLCCSLLLTSCTWVEWTETMGAGTYRLRWNAEEKILFKVHMIDGRLFVRLARAFSETNEPLWELVWCFIFLFIDEIVMNF